MYEKIIVLVFSVGIPFVVTWFLSWLALSFSTPHFVRYFGNAVGFWQRRVLWFALLRLITSTILTILLLKIFGRTELAAALAFLPLIASAAIQMPFIYRDCRHQNDKRLLAYLPKNEKMVFRRYRRDCLDIQSDVSLVRISDNGSAVVKILSIATGCPCRQMHLEIGEELTVCITELSFD